MNSHKQMNKAARRHRMSKPKPARPEDMPKATHEGKTMILGIEVRTYRLDDGRSIIHADDFHKLMEVMGFDGVVGEAGK